MTGNLLKKLGRASRSIPLPKESETTIGTFILGLGAQKAGTSWLHTYFRTVPEIHTGFLKEYHVLDALFVEQMKGRKTALARRTIQALQEGDFHRTANRKLIKLMAMVADREHYFDFFEHRLLKHGGLTCDLTPSHIALPPRALKLVKKSFAERNITVRPIFLMRDPVERCWSAIRMDRRDGRLRNYDSSLSDSAILREEFKSETQRLRTDYAEAIKRFEKVFDKSTIIYGFYETMFTQSFIDHLADSLRFTPVKPDFDKRVNLSAKTSPTLDDDLQREIVQFYSGTYRFMCGKFGDAFMRGIWPSYRFLD